MDKYCSILKHINEVGSYWKIVWHGLRSIKITFRIYSFWLGRCMWFLSWNSWHLSSTGCSSSSVVEEPSSASLCACCLPPLAGMRRMAERRLKNGSGISKILLNRWNVCQREHTHSNESWGSNAACVTEYVYVRCTTYLLYTSPFMNFCITPLLDIGKWKALGKINAKTRK